MEKLRIGQKSEGSLIEEIELPNGKKLALSSFQMWPTYEGWYMGEITPFKNKETLNKWVNKFKSDNNHFISPDEKLFEGRLPLVVYMATVDNWPDIAEASIEWLNSIEAEKELTSDQRESLDNIGKHLELTVIWMADRSNETISEIVIKGLKDLDFDNLAYEFQF